MDLSYIIKPITFDGEVFVPLIKIANMVKQDNWKILECDYYRLINEKGDYLFEYGDMGFELTYLGYAFNYASFKAWKLYDYLDLLKIDYRV